MRDTGRRKTIWLIIIFSVLVNALAWLGPVLGGSPQEPGIGFVLWGIAPLLASIAMRALTRDWADLGLRPGFARNLRWYVASLLSIPVLMLVALFTGVLLSIASISGFSLPEFAGTLAVALPVFLIFAIFEEVGWRGYLAPKLDSLGMNRFAAAIVTGVVWAAWHLPYFRELSWVYVPEDLLTFLPRFTLVCIALSIVFGEIRQITGSFWPAVVMHAVGNAFGHPLSADYVTVAPGMDYLASIGNGLIVIVLFAALGIAIHAARSRPGVERS